jgi:hypothetical protein
LSGFQRRDARLKSTPRIHVKQRLMGIDAIANFTLSKHQRIIDRIIFPKVN